jgi:hypothetical protein
MGQYGLMQDQAFTYSVSTANATGPMQFTDRRGCGTYSMVVRRCEDAELHPDFDTGARDLLNAMKAATCLLDLDLAGMPREVRDEYTANPRTMSIFGVAAYNGGGRNATRLLRAVRRLKADLTDLRISELESRHPEHALPLPVGRPQRPNHESDDSRLQPRKSRLYRQCTCAS